MADPTEADVRTEGLSPAPKPRRRQPLFVGLVALLVVAAAGAGAIWWMHRADDLSVGSKHHVTIHVHKVGPGDCLNNISGVTIRGRYWHSDDHAPDPWGVGGVHGTFEVTASSTTFGDGAAVFTADQGDTVAYKGGYLDGFDPLNCRVGAVGP